MIGLFGPIIAIVSVTTASMWCVRVGRRICDVPERPVVMVGMVVGSRQ
jgi:hypothetical protein